MKHKCNTTQHFKNHVLVKARDDLDHQFLMRLRILSQKAHDSFTVGSPGGVEQPPKIKKKNDM
jgi:hypothetical protein